MFWRYLGVSITALGLDYALLVTLVSRWGVGEAIAAALAYLAGAVWHYVLSRQWVFRRGWLSRRPAVEFAAFLASGLIGLALTTGIVFAATELMGFPLLLSKTAAVLVSYFTAYGLRRALVFRHSM